MLVAKGEIVAMILNMHTRHGASGYIACIPAPDRGVSTHHGGLGRALPDTPTGAGRIQLCHLLRVWTLWHATGQSPKLLCRSCTLQVCCRARGPLRSVARGTGQQWAGGGVGVILPYCRIAGAQLHGPIGVCTPATLWALFVFEIMVDHTNRLRCSTPATSFPGLSERRERIAACLRGA